MISANMMRSLQQQMNSLWYQYKRLRANSKDFKDSDIKDILISLIELGERFEKLND